MLVIGEVASVCRRQAVEGLRGLCPHNPRIQLREGRPLSQSEAAMKEVYLKDDLLCIIQAVTPR